MRIKVGLKCEECGDINYSTYKNSKNTTEKLELKKYCMIFMKKILNLILKIF
nr:50S ribosomal protein L33 [Campylobacter jejuni]